MTYAREIYESAVRRRGVPVRSLFARDLSESGAATMARLIRVGGRGGEVLLKLYLALIWRSSREPYNTAIPARKWAELLALPAPATNGARRIVDAISTLERHRLVEVEQRRGGPSVVTLLNETGNGIAYAPPRGSGEADRYFQIPVQLWLTGALQQLSAPALAMLMAVLSEQTAPGMPVWWSTSRFPGRFGISAATRARGTRELRDAGLLVVSKQAVSTSPITSFAPERVRSVYKLAGDAVLLPPTPTKREAAKTRERNSRG